MLICSICLLDQIRMVNSLYFVTLSLRWWAFWVFFVYCWYLVAFKHKIVLGFYPLALLNSFVVTTFLVFLLIFRDISRIYPSSNFLKIKNTILLYRIYLIIHVQRSYQQCFYLIIIILFYSLAFFRLFGQFILMIWNYLLDTYFDVQHFLFVLFKKGVNYPDEWTSQGIDDSLKKVVYLIKDHFIFALV